MTQILSMKKKNTAWIQEQKNQSRITMLTAYDYPTALLMDEAGIDLILVGDSVATTIHGYESTIHANLEMMTLHCSAVSRATRNAMVIGDLPFMSYQKSPEQALESSGILVQKGLTQAVKLEGGQEFSQEIKKITRAGIPVMAHIGLTPQSIYKIGKYRKFGKNPTESTKILEDALAVQEAGAFAVVLECVDSELAKTITEKLSIPTIGIGSGSFCDGEVLVFHDLVGLTPGKVPSFVEKTAEIRPEISQAIQKFISRTKELK